MQNLVYPKKQVLISTLAVTDFGAYTDSVTTKKVLMVKKNGHQIPYDSAKVTVTASHSRPGILKSVLLKTLAPCPCADCNAEYGLAVVKMAKDPGVQNDDYYNKPRYYGSVIDRIATCVNGQMADADKVIMEQEIIDQITADYEATARENAIVYARRLYAVTDDDTADASTITVVKADGTSVTVTASATGAGQLYTAFMADANVNTVLTAYKYGADGILITSINPGYKFTVAAGTDTTVVARHIWLLAKTVNDKFEVEFKDGWFEKTSLSLYSFNTTAATATNFHYSYDGGNAGTHTGASEANFEADLATLGALTNGYWSQVSATHYFAAYGHDVWIDLDNYYTISSGTETNNCTVLPLTAANGTGAYPYLTSDDVFRTFMNEKHLDGLTHIVYLDQPTEGSVWTKIVITADTEQGAIHGASHRTNSRIVYEFYIKQGGFGTSIWDASGYMWESTADGAFTADSTFLDFLVYWGLTDAQVNALRLPS